ncbi:glycosyltransferase family 2 protein [Meiothermus hypogaeus]|uniref:Glycosyl transferase n=3 Tax=Meiothermus hypogaeus TaxID=884155 RepID=A0A511R4A2_9DEIN|nr:glycosyltransferase family 2 protein [Meiothermus hypogaeus]RIH75247.1 GalNAc(5)-diNAcBac-PP-undecaprenol beta-1,3-glucosyltransferase [Meiothermus hypogaeus]GEM84438.1 glycosyl transferase [Meiothermus hypogaeus NBRC 106114]
MQSQVSFSVVISTYNRAHLVSRAIKSVLSQGYSNLEIIVVDDASSDDTAEIIRENFPKIRYIRQESNQGPGPARDRGIREASNQWVVILDDDDELLPKALLKVEESMCLQGLLTTSRIFPVIQFAHSNGSIPDQFKILTIEDYFRGDVLGDFVPVINRMHYISCGFTYPRVRIGGEHMLWWKIAKQYGIPTWNIVITKVHEDAPIRLTSPQNQISRAAEYARLQETTLEEFGVELLSKYPKLYYVKLLGAATYYLLAREKTKARKYLKKAWQFRPTTNAGLLWLLSYMPELIVHKLFVLYRRKGGV